MKIWGACWEPCASGLPRTWYAAHTPTQAVLLTLAQKYVKGKPCKPYNSTLGEFFRVCHLLRVVAANC